MNADPNARDKMLNDLSSTLTPASESISDTPPAPPVIPDHELFRRIGRGSYGEVWLARTALGTWRAVKIVQRAGFDHDRPYEREFEGIRRFEPVSRTHPSQLNVLHVGRNDAAGHFYYVMELADDAGGTPTGGTSSASPQSLPTESGTRVTRPSETKPSTYIPRTLRSDLLQRGRLPFEECLDIGLALATALDHLHRNGLVHRDIKPSNIVFVNGIPKLADIGLVAQAEATLSLVGTEGYLPPEGPGTPQADIYSLGKVLYEMATGRDRQEFPELPTNLIAQPAAERAQLSELNEIIVRACHTDLTQRYQTAADLHAELALLQSGKSVSRMRTVERRLKFVTRAGAVVTAVAVIAGLAFLYQQVQTREARRLAAENARLGEQNRNRIVRLDVANGVRLLDEGDSAGALLWFADALPLVSNKSAEESTHRIRIQQTLNQTPRLLRVLPHDTGVLSSAFSPDGRFIATGTDQDGKLTVWDAGSGARVWESKTMGGFVSYVRFSRDGESLLACSSRQQGFAGPGGMPHFFAVLDAKSGRERFPAAEVLPGRSTNLLWSTFSPDDRWLAVSLRGSVVRVLDLRDGHLVTELRGHQKDVCFLSFSADGSLLASASADKTVRLWRLPSGEPAGPPLEHRLPVIRAILTDDGRRLVSGSQTAGECELQAWDVPTGRRLGDPLKGKGGMAMFVEPGAGGRFFGGMNGDKNNFTHVWDFSSFREALPTLEITSAQCWAFSPDGKRLAIGGDDGTALMWSLTSGEVLRGPIWHDRWLDSIQFSPDGQRLLTAGADRNARVWDMAALPAESARFQLPGRVVQSSGGGFRSSPVYKLQDGTMFLVDPDSLKELFQLKNPNPDEPMGMNREGNSGRCWAISTARSTNDTSTTVFLVREEGGTLRKLSLKHPGGITQMRFTPDDGQLVTCGEDHVIRFWRTTDGLLDRTVATQKSEGEVVDISPDAKIGFWLRAIDTFRGDAVQLLDLDSGKIIGTPYILTGPLTGSQFSPDAKRLALVDPNGPVTILDVGSGKVSISGIEHTRNLSSVEWSPDGRRLLTAGTDGQVLVWDAESGEQLLAPLRLPVGSVNSPHWSPDGRFIVGWSDKQQARVWDAATGEAVTPLLKHSGDIQFAFMPNSQRLITASYPDLLRAWDLTESHLAVDVIADYAKLVSGRRLNDAGVMLPLKPDELAALNRSLHARAPQLFK